MEKLRTIFNAGIVSNKKDFIWASKRSCMSHKIFDTDLVGICKRKVTLY